MPHSSWLEISLIVEPELVEPVAEVMGRYIPNGVAIESTGVYADDEDQNAKAIGPLKVAGYIPINDQTEAVRKKIEEGLWYLSRIRPFSSPQFRTVNETDWAEAWKEHYHPIPIGERLIVLPAWIDEQYEDRIIIRMDPGMAFGTGTHPTTQLCLEYIEEIFHDANIPAPDKQQVPSSVIDIGCGSGILGIAAIKLGAQRVLAVDTDPLAVHVTKENAALNKVSGKDMIVEMGSLADILDNRYSVRQADLVLANILAPVLVRMLDEGLSGLLLPGGKLILSGIIETQVDDIKSAAIRNRLGLISQKQIDDWISLQFRVES